MVDMPQNKREFTRINAEAHAIYKVLGDPIDLSGTGYLKTTTKNISNGGLCISAPRKIAKGYIVKVGLELDTADKPISAFCEVKWCAKAGSEFEAGLKFLSLEDKDVENIREYIAGNTNIH